MKAVLLSTQPRHVENICTVVGEKDGKPIYKKRVEVRKTAPKLKTPFTVYIYQTRKHWVYKVLKWLKLYRGKVIGEFVCDKIEKIDLREMEDTAQIQREACLTRRELFVYLNEEIGYLWHISELKIYDKPKELGEFVNCNKDCKSCQDHWLSDSYAVPTYVCLQKKYIKRPSQSWCYVGEL